MEQLQRGWAQKYFAPPQRFNQQGVWKIGEVLTAPCEVTFKSSPRGSYTSFLRPPCGSEISLARRNSRCNCSMMRCVWQGFNPARRAESASLPEKFLKPALHLLRWTFVAPQALSGHHFYSHKCSVETAWCQMACSCSAVENC